MDRLVYQQLTEIQATLGLMVPLLSQIIGYLETAAQPPSPPMARYEAMYTDDPIEPGPPEGEHVAEAIARPSPDRWEVWRRLFTRSHTP